MALTLPALGKALEDVTKALDKNTVEVGKIKGAYDKKIETIERIVKIKQGALTLSDFLPKDVTVDTASTEQRTAAQKALDKYVQKEEEYHTVIRNRRGSVSVPEPAHDTDAVNKAYIDKHLVPLESRMPLNPVRAYDMADEWCHEKLLYKISTPIINKKEATILQYHAVYTKNQAETYYHVHLESSSTGNAQPALILYRQDWAPQTYIIWEYCNGVQDFFVSIPQQNFDFGIGIWMHGDGSYQVQSDDSVTVHKFTVTEITEKRLIDSSGTGNHATITVDAVKVNDNTVGTALLLMKGSLTSNFSSFIGVGKQWTHSRWIKINDGRLDPNAPQDQEDPDSLDSLSLWSYGPFDSAAIEIEVDDYEQTTVLAVVFRCKKDQLECKVVIPDIDDNKWHNLVVMTDLQPTYCRKIVFVDGEKFEHKKEGDFSSLSHGAEWTDFKEAHGSLASLLFFDRFLTEAEMQWLAHNSYYPAKRYSLAEYKADQCVPKSAFSLSNTTLSIEM